MVPNNGMRDKLSSTLLLSVHSDLSDLKTTANRNTSQADVVPAISYSTNSG